MRRWLLPTILLLTLTPLLPVHAQGSSGILCVLAFEDLNENGVRDSGEAVFPGISVNVAVNTDVITATHITDPDSAPYCFENLPPNDYHLYFADSPNHRPTTENDAALTLEAGQRLRVEFGAVPQDPLRTPEEAAAENTSEQLSNTTRIMVALLGAVLVMVFMIGFGVVLASVLY
jgi:hypothetical protein